MQPIFSIDQTLCTACGLCAAECGAHVPIEYGNRVNPENPRCSQCFHCYTICPRNAIQWVSEPETIQYNRELLQEVSSENLLHFLAYRRSIRHFEDRPVEDGIIAKLIKAARYIPSGGNAHFYEFTVLKSASVKLDILNELTRIYRKRSLLLNNTILRNLAKPFVNKQMRGFLKSREYGRRMRSLVGRIENGENPFFYNAPVVVIIHSAQMIPTPKEDCVLAGYNICLMAQTLKLGSCFVTLAQNAINASRQCKKILGLSPRDNVHAVVILGYPAANNLRIAPKPGKKIHWR